MTPDKWLKEVAQAVSERLPDAMVDDVDDGSLAICRGKAAVAVATVGEEALVLASLDRGGYGPWSPDRVAQDEPRILHISDETIDEAVNAIVSLLI
jgi:hypothetical protein